MTTEAATDRACCDGGYNKDEIQSIEMLQRQLFNREPTLIKYAAIAMIRELPQVDDSQWSSKLSNFFQLSLKPADFWAARLSKMNLECRLPRGHQFK